MTAAEAPLSTLDENWSTALAVVAHPGDMEFGAAAAVAHWTEAGKHIVYCMVTSGEAGIDGMAPEVAREVRTAEQINSAAIVGVQVVEFLGRPDGILEYGVDLRRRIAAIVRKYRPEIVMTNSFADRWPGGPLNQADHIAVGRATLDAVRDAANRWIFPEQLGSELDRWDGVRQVWMAGSPTAEHAVDITDTFDRGVESLQAHRAYLDGLNQPDFDPATLLGQFAEITGRRLGVRYATAFEVFSIRD